MPEMGESVTEGIVLEWHVAEGDFVNEGDTVVEVSTDKVDAEVPAPMDGVITKLLAAVDDEVPVGAPMAEMEAGEGLRGFGAARPRGLTGGAPAGEDVASLSDSPWPPAEWRRERRRTERRQRRAARCPRDAGRAAGCGGDRGRSWLRSAGAGPGARSPRRTCWLPGTAAGTALPPLPARRRRCGGRRRCWPRRWTRAGRCRRRPRSGRSRSTRWTRSARRSTRCSKSAG